MKNSAPARTPKKRTAARGLSPESSRGRDGACATTGAGLLSAAGRGAALMASPSRAASLVDGRDGRAAAARRAFESVCGRRSGRPRPCWHAQLDDRVGNLEGGLEAQRLERIEGL